MFECLDDIIFECVGDIMFEWVNSVIKNNNKEPNKMG